MQALDETSAVPQFDARMHDDGALARDLGAVAARLCAVTVAVHARSQGGDGSGSGVIWRPDGLIVTNAHVARGSRAAVELADGRTFAARIVARDPRFDLAALRVEADRLPTPLLRHVDGVRVGELVIAAGHPLGVAGAVAVGIVHAVGRDENGARWVGADLRLMPGNSGGPLADASGRVIGINAMVARGLGIAIAVDCVARFLRGDSERAPRVA